MKLHSLSWRHALLMSLGVIIVTAGILWYLGHPLICECGYVKLWHGIAYSNENSQHLTDWYTLSHIIHGFLFYALFTWLGRRFGWSIGVSFILAVLLESSWEILENTPLIINRYREATIALDYFGDSVLNSIMDIVSMAVGFFLARKWPVWLSIMTVIGLELFAAYFIKDNLTLNVIMLLWPLDFIRNWQSGS